MIILTAILLFATTTVPFRFAALGNTTLIKNDSLNYPPLSGNIIQAAIVISPLLTLRVSGILSVTGGVYTLTNFSHEVLQAKVNFDNTTPGYFPMNDPYWSKFYQQFQAYVETLKTV